MGYDPSGTLSGTNRESAGTGISSALIIAIDRADVGLESKPVPSFQDLEVGEAEFVIQLSPAAATLRDSTGGRISKQRRPVGARNELAVPDILEHKNGGHRGISPGLSVGVEEVYGLSNYDLGNDGGVVRYKVRWALLKKDTTARCVPGGAWRRIIVSGAG